MIAYHRTAAVGWNPARAQFRGSQAVLSGPFPRALLTGYGLGQVGNDLEFCQKVRCGVVLQHETSLDRITACHSKHPETRGALSWCDPRCSEFWAEIASRHNVQCAGQAGSPAPAVAAASAVSRPGQPRPHPILFVPGPPVAPRWTRPACGPVKNGCGCNGGGGQGGCGCKKGSAGNGGNGEQAPLGALAGCVGLLIGGWILSAVFGGAD